MQLAGRICSMCGKKIVFADEGRICLHCNRVVHIRCEGSVCSVCGATLAGFVRPETDALRDALVPRALRAGKTGAAAFAVLFIFLLVLLAFYAISLA